MHPYTIDTGVRKKVIIYIFIFSIVLRIPMEMESEILEVLQKNWII